MFTSGPLRRTAVELAEEAVKEREEEKKELLQQQSLKETYVLVTQEADSFKAHVPTGLYICMQFTAKESSERNAFVLCRTHTAEPSPSRGLRETSTWSRSRVRSTTRKNAYASVCLEKRGLNANRT
jgi:hypothetical protein